HLGRLRAFARGHGVNRAVEWRVVQLEHALVGDDLNAVPGRGQAPDDARGGKDDSVSVPGGRGCRPGVQRPAQLEAAPELRLVLRQRTAAALNAPPAGLDVGVEMDDEGVELSE